MRSTEGTGKGTFVDLFGEIFGAHYLKVSNSDHLVGKFNAHLCANLLLFADEARWAGDRSSEGILKSLITEKEIMLEAKYFDAVPVDNFSKIIFASNMDWVVPAGKSDRRYMVFDLSADRANEKEYFTAIRTEWKNGGKEAFFKFLMTYNLTEIDLINDRPNTSAMKEQKELTMNPQEKWYQQLLIEGTFKSSEMSDPIDLNENEKTEINSDFLLQNYDQFCKSQNVRHKLAKNDLSRFLSKHIPELARTRKGISKTTYWVFPPLRDLRSQWDTDYNCKSDWKVPEQIEDVAVAQISFLDQ
jgi:hypothetical protein